ncbi:MAG: YncE family protein [Prevotellaceae bacterium]|jgi:DNA-binding beta-propeller fold protein YncE|nr:YncE family protein [Prevotellaceae bacterium]
MIKQTFFTFAAALSLAACRTDEPPLLPTTTAVAGSGGGAVQGFYLLNEGNMGSNKASLDYFDYATGVYSKNIFPSRNPHVANELGDVGNDIRIYGGKLYAVVNCSHLVEVMDVRTAVHIAAVSVPNCRYAAFHEGYAYVSSYAGPVQIDPNARLGYVAKIDTATLRVVDTCVVGYQPEEMAVRGNTLYVANSGGYRAPAYDRTVSVIDLATFAEIKKIDVGVNLHRMKKDSDGNLWVSSRGDYYGVPSSLYVIDAADRVAKRLPLAASNMALAGDSLYIYSTEWDYAANEQTVTYAIVNTKTQSIASHHFITDGTAQRIAVPYGIAVNPDTREIFITDAKDYVTPGTLYCFSPAGALRWEVVAGDIPAHIVFHHKNF